jgi:hypothetical protein
LRASPSVGVIKTIYFGGGTPSILTAVELSLIFETIRQVLPKESRAAQFKFLYKDVKMHVVRDGLAFGVFFGVFESALRVAKASTAYYVKKRVGEDLSRLRNMSVRCKIDSLEREWHEMKSKPYGWTFALVNGGTTVLSGAMAGMAYQLVSLPIKQIYKSGGQLQGAYRGISSRLMRSMPSSAVGLLLYEMVRE